MANQVTTSVYADLSSIIYHDGKTQIPTGWQLVNVPKDMGMGFRAEAWPDAPLYFGRNV